MNENLTPRTEITSDQPKTILLGTIGAIVGALIGFVIFKLLMSVGLYALVAPGAIAGFVANRFARQPSIGVGLISFAVAAVATVFSEWNVAPFIADDSLPYFLTHLHKLRPATLIMGALGIIFAFLAGRGR